MWSVISRCFMMSWRPERDLYFLFNLPEKPKQIFVTFFSNQFSLRCFTLNSSGKMCFYFIPTDFL